MFFSPTPEKYLRSQLKTRTLNDLWNHSNIEFSQAEKAKDPLQCCFDFIYEKVGNENPPEMHPWKQN